MIGRHRLETPQVLAVSGCGECLLVDDYKKLIESSIADFKNYGGDPMQRVPHCCLANLPGKLRGFISISLELRA